MAKSKPISKTKAPAKEAAPSPAKTTVKNRAVAQSTQEESIISRDLTSDTALGRLLAEFLGTFGLVGVLLCTGGNAFIAGLTLIVFVLAFGRISGTHINPGVTIAMLTAKKVSWLQACAYIFVQLLGAMVAFVVFTYLANNAAPVQTQFGEINPKVFAPTALANGNWQPFLVEALGALIFGLGIGAATLTKRGGFQTAFLVGGALTLGLLAASFSSAAILNPAVALGLDAYKFATEQAGLTLAVYALAPVIGITAGVWLYKFMLSGNKDAANA